MWRLVGSFVSQIGRAFCRAFQIERVEEGLALLYWLFMLIILGLSIGFCVGYTLTW